MRDTHLEFRVLLYSPDGTLLAKFQVKNELTGVFGQFSGNRTW